MWYLHNVGWAALYLDPHNRQNKGQNGVMDQCFWLNLKLLRVVLVRCGCVGSTAMFDEARGHHTVWRLLKQPLNSLHSQGGQGGNLSVDHMHCLVCTCTFPDTLVHELLLMGQIIMCVWLAANKMR